jgi:hypothetical protein
MEPASSRSKPDVLLLARARIGLLFGVFFVLCALTLIAVASSSSIVLETTLEEASSCAEGRLFSLADSVVLDDPATGWNPPPDDAVVVAVGVDAAVVVIGADETPPKKGK